MIGTKSANPIFKLQKMYRITLIFILLSGLSISQEKQLVTIKGYAPAYVGKSLDVNEILDYFTMKEGPIASTTVKEDSTFSVSFFLEETQKVVLHSNRNRSIMYIEPGAKYDIYLPDKDPYEPYRPNGNNVEVTFFGLDSTDINYKILTYLRWQDEFIGEYYYLKALKPLEFSQNLDRFKVNVEKYYAKDSSDVYFMTFIRFSIASLYNIQHAADRNRYEKHDFYIKNFPVSYRNDAYMGYVSTFYEKMMPRLPMETNNRVYLGILKSSPTLIMRALGSEYTLINMRIREMVMIKALGEAFYTGEYPQTNILTILDSVSTTPLFQSNGIIAKNMIIRLTDLVPGGKAPDFAAANLQGEMKTLLNYRDKHLYIHFFDPTSQKSIIQTDPLIKLYEQYNKDVTFITICPDKSRDSVAKSQLDKIPWGKFILDEKSPVFKLYKVSTFPCYILIDEMGYVVAAPALTPMPNGQYETIDKTFFYIKKAREEMEQYRR